MRNYWNSADNLDLSILFTVILLPVFILMSLSTNASYKRSFLDSRLMFINYMVSAITLVFRRWSSGESHLKLGLWLTSNRNTFSSFWIRKSNPKISKHILFRILFGCPTLYSCDKWGWALMRVFIAISLICDQI